MSAPDAPVLIPRYCRSPDNCHRLVAVGPNGCGYLMCQRFAPVEPAPVVASRSEWQPIETAPRNGTLILLARPSRASQDWSMSVAVYNINIDLWTTAGTGYFPDPTHWMPLPPPPAVRAGARGEP